MAYKENDIFSRLKPEARKIVIEICARALLRKHQQNTAQKQSGKQAEVSKQAEAVGQ